jgi:hypothetical protein
LVWTPPWGWRLAVVIVARPSWGFGQYFCGSVFLWIIIIIIIFMGHLVKGVAAVTMASALLVFCDQT